MFKNPFVFRAMTALLGVIVLVSASLWGAEFRIGLLSFSPGHDPAVQGFMEALSELGSHDEDAVITYVYNGAVGAIDGLQAEAQRLLSEDLDLLFAVSTPAALAAQAATEDSTLPVVFSVVSDPVSSGVVASLRSPGGNLTGVKVGGCLGKLLEWLLAVDPSIGTVFVPHNPSDGGAVAGLAELEPAAKALGLQLLVEEVTTVEALRGALTEIPSAVDAVLANSSGFLQAQIDAYVTESIARKLPLGSVCSCVDAGVLVSFGHDYWRDGVQAARLAHQILHGVPPSDIPVETADFFLGLNLATAEAIGLYITDEILDQADYIAR